jgi:ATP-dependent exoDNAse (exonuclease V) beta subunit
VTRVARPDSLPPASDRFVVVEASAGTGKTFFLEHRVIDLVLAGADLSQLLLVTFTDKAVAELRMRIRDLLDRTSRIDRDAPASDRAPAPLANRYWDIDDAARARLRAAVTAFDHAPIFTIHGFCHRILIEDAFAARRLFDQRQVADEVAFDTAFSSLLRERFATTSPDRELLSAYLEWGGTVDNLRDLLLKCARADTRVTRRFDADRAIAVMDNLRATLGTQAQREQLMHATNWKGQQRYVPGWLATIATAIERTATDQPASILGACDKLRVDGAKVAKYAGATPAGRALVDAIKLMPLDEAIAAEL